MDKLEDKKNRPRPEWHVDAKWITALIFIPIFALTFLAYNLFQMTKKENSVKVAGALISAVFPVGDTEESLTQVRKAIQESPDKSLKPFPGTNVKITEADLNKYSASELRQKLFQELATSIYDSDKSSSSNLGLLVVFTKAGHDFIGKLLLIFSAVSLVLLALLILFSAGFGKALVPGIIFVILGLLPTFFLFAIDHAPENSSPVPVGSEADIKQMATMALSKIAPQLSEIFFKNYLALTITGVLLLLVGIIGRIVQRIKSRRP